MPEFDTPESIAVTVELGVGNLRIVASDRADTVVDVRPTDEADEADVQAAAQVRVDYADGALRITGPKRIFDFSRKNRSVDVTVELPSGSGISAHLWMGDIRCAGRLGDCRLKTNGDLWVERTGDAYLHTGGGHITADSITGNAEIYTGVGKIQVGDVGGTAAIKNSTGDTLIDSVGGDLRVRSATGNIQVERAAAGVDAKTSHGDIRIGEVVRGTVVVGTAMGDLDLGIAEGTAAWLEVNTSFGHLRNRLDDTTPPDAAEQTVEVHGRTAYGDITIHRS